ncbi:hypothetical protein CL684_02590 [Candidatus Campbellbacteria bacterium]|nr:hypothetical protein [Candidatus Campbellbacteria bacterium]|tara:strand:- start:5872 stop:6651 length:780 start_codon:yes stop_codon:yes gene_type:complete
MKKLLSILNVIVVLGTIYWNYFIAQNGINGNTITEISSMYSSALTPASYAFSIWGLIFAGLLLYAAYYVYRAFVKKNVTNIEAKEIVLVTLVNIGNIFWSYVNLSEWIGWSVLILAGMTYLLYKAIQNSNIGRYDASTQIITCVWWPIGLYGGWTLAATFANLGQYLDFVGCDNLCINSLAYAYIALIILAVVYMYVLIKHNLRITVMVGVWATTAVGFANYPDNFLLSLFAWICALALCILAALHAYKNRKTLPFLRK